YTAGAVAPGDGTSIYRCSIVPEWAADDIIAVSQRGHSGTTDLIIGSRADKTVGAADHTGAASDTVAPGNGSDEGDRTVVPSWAADNIVAVGQGVYSLAADKIRVGSTDEAVAGTDETADTGGAIAPGHRPGTRDAAILPARTNDHIIAVAEGY